MININQIERLIDQNEFVRLVERVLQNGRCSEPAIRSRLAQPGVAPITGRALALQRTLELSFGPTRTSSILVRSLVRSQTSDGWFGHSDQLIVSTAVAVRALCDAEYVSTDHAAVQSAITDGLRAIGQQQSNSGGFNDDPLTDAIVLWQLGPLADRCAEYIDLVALQKTVARTPLGSLRNEALAAAA